MSTMPVLRRYTNLAAAVHLLMKKKITLLDPATWDDKVDVDYIRQCRKWIQSDKSSRPRPILALCFGQGPESYHHWRIYASGTDGVCIVFDKDRLLHEIDSKYEDQLMHQDVDYKSYKEAVNDPPDILDILFLKRPAYRDEKEYRIVYAFDKDEKPATTRDYDISLSCIRGIVISPWLPKNLYESVKTVLTSIDGCQGLDISRSTLIESERWKQFGKDAYGAMEEMERNRPDFIPSGSE